MDAVFVERLQKVLKSVGFARPHVFALVELVQQRAELTALAEETQCPPAVRGLLLDAVHDGCELLNLSDAILERSIAAVRLLGESHAPIRDAMCLKFAPLQDKLQANLQELRRLAGMLT